MNTVVRVPSVVSRKKYGKTKQIVDETGNRFPENMMYNSPGPLLGSNLPDTKIER